MTERTYAREDVPALLAEVERLRTRAALADAMIERVARDTAAKESFTSRRRWWELPHDERTRLRAHAHRVLAADLGTGAPPPAAPDTSAHDDTEDTP